MFSKFAKSKKKKKDVISRNIFRDAYQKKVV